MGKILVTGGAGYIGSHVVKALSDCGYEPLIIDNLSTGHQWAVPQDRLIVADLADQDLLRSFFAQNLISAVIHLAGSQIVPESVQNPLKYYQNNVAATLSLLEVMQEYQVKRMIFSSTAAVYGLSAQDPVSEDASLQPINPYGWSKLMIEQILKDLAKAGILNYVSLRYFNVAGADPQTSLGEGKKDATHLITRALRTAQGLYDYLEVYGTDYPTPDGTCIRDYIHVADLAAVHILALEYLLTAKENQVFNCGYNKGYSVLEVIAAVKRITHVDFPVRYAEKRAGDPSQLIADSRKIKELLAWSPKYDNLNSIVETGWRWEEKRLALFGRAGER